jgi:hypothetical protein
MLVLTGKPICVPCAEAKAQEAKAGGSNLEFAGIIDPTICGLCKTDYGSSELPFIGGIPVCANCARGLYERPYPGWLKLAMAGLLLLLAGSLWRGVPYFIAGRHLVLAERAMDRNDYKTARVHFAEVLKVSPTEQEVLLLGAKANLMTGDAEGAQKFLKQRGGYKSSDLFTEVDGMWNRAVDAYDKAVKAKKLYESRQEDEAARLMREASSEYPQSEDLALSALNLELGVAFNHKDYDTFLRLSEAVLARAPGDPMAAGGVASALACKYAVTGDPEYRKQAEQMLEKAKVLAQQSPQAKAAFEEYAERIRYRLESRVIIDKPEYDRRFRQEAKR